MDRILKHLNEEQTIVFNNLINDGVITIDKDTDDCFIARYANIDDPYGQIPRSRIDVIKRVVEHHTAQKIIKAYLGETV